MQSYLNAQAFHSPLKSTSVIKPNSQRVGKTLVAALILTSLVDAFSILVIYLLMNTSAATEQMDLEKDLTLPMASHSEMLQAGVVVTTIDGKYKIKDQELEAGQLMEALKALNAELEDADDQRQKNLVIQADKDSSFETLNPIIMAGTQSGFETIKFAVLPNEGADK